MLRQDQMLKLLMGSPKLQVETHSHGAEDSDTAQRDYGEYAAWERRVDVGLEVEIVLIILIHPKSEISNDKRLKNDQHLDKTWNVSSRSLNMLFFFQAEDGIRDLTVTGVQTCALPI